MTNIWLEAFLGKIGKFLISFLSKSYYYIIPLVLIYGIFLALSSYNLKRIEKKVDLEIFNQSKVIMVKDPGINYVDLVEKINIPWEEIIKTYSFFPYISQESDLWVIKTSPFNARNIIMKSDKKIKIVLERNGIHNFREKPPLKRNLYLEYIHRVTRRKEE